jgi:ElaB/YqjD/DUF883 family membrane-anchored ribosome-binding protein
MNTETNRTPQTSEDVLNDLRTLVAEAERILAQAPEGNSEGTCAALHERFEAAQERLGQFYDGAKKKVIAGTRATDHVIRENPYQSIAIALGLGLLAGVLIGRRTK